MFSTPSVWSTKANSVSGNKKSGYQVSRIGRTCPNTVSLVIECPDTKSLVLYASITGHVLSGYWGIHLLKHLDNESPFSLLWYPDIRKPEYYSIPKMSGGTIIKHNTKLRLSTSNVCILKIERRNYYLTE